MNNDNVRKAGLEGKNYFLDFFNPYSYKYSEVLGRLGYGNLDNLVEVVRNKIYSLAEGYEVYDEYFFYSSISGYVIISMFEAMIEDEYKKLVDAFWEIENSTAFQIFFYYLRRNNWLLQYEALLSFCSNFKIEDVKDTFFECFYNTINKEEFLDRKEEFIEYFKIELMYLTNQEQVRCDFDKYLIKKRNDK